VTPSYTIDLPRGSDFPGPAKTRRAKARFWNTRRDVHNRVPLAAEKIASDPQRVSIEPGGSPRDKAGGKFKLRQNQVDGLVVMNVLGRPSGRTLGIVGTVYPYHVPHQTHFEMATAVDEQMGISFDEAC